MAAIQRELDALQRFNNAGAGVKAGRNAGWNANKSAGIGNELNDDEQNDTDDLVELKQKIEAMEPDSEERKMCVREWRRLKRIPAGSVENGVIRTYVRISGPDPWNSLTMCVHSLIGSHLFHGQTRHRSIPRLVTPPLTTSQNPSLKLPALNLMWTISG